MKIKEGNINFDFNFDTVIKLDDTTYYREDFIKLQNGIKAVDILCCNNNSNYFIEIKDYTYPNTKSLKLLDFISAIISKIIGSLAILYPMSLNATEQEKKILEKFLLNKSLKLILHLKLPPPRNTLDQSNWNLLNLKLELKRKLKNVVNNVITTSETDMRNLPWRVK